MAKKKKSKQNLAGFDRWGPEKLAAYFGKVGLGGYDEVVMKHKLTGELAPFVTDGDLKDMGIKIVGDRLRFRQVIRNMTKKARVQERSKVIWSGEERLYWSCFDWSYNTCCGCSPIDPSTYKLSSNHFKAKIAEPGRCGPVKVCCCYSYQTNNIDLSQITDVDVNGVPAPCCQRVCCCAYGKDIINVSYDRDKTLLITLRSGEGDDVSEQILNQVEEAQVMERD